MNSTPSHFISCDWGTTNLRLEVVEIGTGQAVGGISNASGAARIARSANDRAIAYRSELEKEIRLLSDEISSTIEGAPIVVSGMASSSIGWKELPYASVPFRLDGSDVQYAALEPVKGSEVFLMSGVRTENDVIRGEENELIGLFQLPEYAQLADRAIVVMPGTHSKHMFVEKDRMIRFRTFMTGELFDVLSSHTVLSHSVNQNHLLPTSKESFLAGVKWTQDKRLSESLFRIRTNELLHGLTPDENRSFLSGIVIGQEVERLQEYTTDDAPIIIIGPAELRKLYGWAAEFFEIQNISSLACATAGACTSLGHLKFLERVL